MRFTAVKKYLFVSVCGVVYLLIANGLITGNRHQPGNIYTPYTVVTVNMKGGTVGNVIKPPKSQFHSVLDLTNLTVTSDTHDLTSPSTAFYRKIRQFVEANGTLWKHRHIELCQRLGDKRGKK